MAYLNILSVSMHEAITAKPRLGIFWGEGC